MPRGRPHNIELVGEIVSGINWFSTEELCFAPFINPNEMAPRIRRSAEQLLRDFESVRGIAIALALTLSGRKPEELRLKNGKHYVCWTERELARDVLKSERDGEKGVVERRVRAFESKCRAIRHQLPDVLSDVEAAVRTAFRAYGRAIESDRPECTLCGAEATTVGVEYSPRAPSGVLVRCGLCATCLAAPGTS